MKLFLILIAFTSTMLVKAQTSGDVWINEFHYDGMTSYGQSDQNEFVEIIIKTSISSNPAEFAKYSLVLYTSGALDNTALTLGRGLPYNTSSPLYTQAETVHPLSTFTACASGTPGFTILSKNLSILQDLPAAMAIVYDNSIVVQLLSYEKTFKIAPAPAGGAAAGQTTTLMITAAGDPADETATTQNTHAVALVGNGFTYSNFTWSDAIIQGATPCAINGGQTLASAAPLPVRWLDFKVAGSGDKIYVQWRVAEETNAVKYEVELSTDGALYIKAGEVLKNVSLQGKYNHTLSGLAKGIYYLRIKEVDNDGRNYYSSVRQVRLGKNDHSITVFPNPVKGGSALLQILPSEKGTYTAYLVDAIGKVVKQQQLIGLESGQLNTITLDLKNVRSGTYRLKVKGSKEELVTNIVILQ